MAKGYNQQHEIDYSETYSPVIRATTIRTIISLAVTYDWPIRQIDVTNAFLHGSLTEEVYMSQPPGFINHHHPDLVCKLHRALYGLKQALRAWYTRLTQFLCQQGFISSKVDSSLFIRINSANKLFILIYVDDILITGSSLSDITSVMTALQREFPLRDLGPLHYFLGIEVIRSSNSLLLSQQ